MKEQQLWRRIQDFFHHGAEFLLPLKRNVPGAWQKRGEGRLSCYNQRETSFDVCLLCPRVKAFFPRGRNILFWIPSGANLVGAYSPPSDLIHQWHMQYAYVPRLDTPLNSSSTTAYHRYEGTTALTTAAYHRYEGVYNCNNNAQGYSTR